MILHLLVYLAVGGAAGYLAGLFGVGGGIIIVPVLSALFATMGFFPAVMMPMTIGTSMAVVSITSIFSARTHHRNGNVDWTIVKMLTPTVILGVIGGGILGSIVSREVLVLCVIAFELTVASMFLYQAWNKNGHAEISDQKKQWAATPMRAISLPLGMISSIVGIAGGTFFVPFLTFCGIDMRKAIGSAAALGVPISAVATIIYIATGLIGNKPLPDYSLGFVYLPAFAGCVAGGMWTTKHGADLAKKLNLRWLKCAFALVLLAAAAKMLLLYGARS